MNRLANFSALALLGLGAVAYAEPPRQISGIYPHLAMFNEEGECGTGAVVPWADRLWVITYAPHQPLGSTDKLYEVKPSLEQLIRDESVGGTPANRMIHRETNQLLIGPYLIDQSRTVRAIHPTWMPGRLTGVARHLTKPQTHAYYATMEEGLYSVDLKSLAIEELIKDGNDQPSIGGGVNSTLPGYHGKGLYSGQGRLVYANNGDRDPKVLVDPSTSSGALAEWTKPGDDWQLIRRNQFTEVTGPGGIYGNENPATDPIWSIGWDHRSVLLMCLQGGKWQSYRLPKGSHSYDGAHGWNTEWPRIRDIGERDLLMTMHGTFWRFPRQFSTGKSSGILPRSNYLKVIGDFALWNGRLVFGCDDTAKKAFLNERASKGSTKGPGQSQSNLWFLQPSQVDNQGPVIGRGAIWLQDKVNAKDPSEPYYFDGYDHREIQVFNGGAAPVSISLEVDAAGNGQWAELRKITVPAGEAYWYDFPPNEKGAWIRATSEQEAENLTVCFNYRNRDTRSATGDAMFAGIAAPAETDVQGGLIYARGEGAKSLRYLAGDKKGRIGCYDLNGDLRLDPVDDAEGESWMTQNYAIPTGVLQFDPASVIYKDNKGRWRLPRGTAELDTDGVLGADRVCREVCTERDLLNAGGIFYELPAENAGGAAKMRPITTHNRRIKDFASYRGLLLLTGLKKGSRGEHILTSLDGKASLWAGAVDDLWKFGKPRGFGGPWRESNVEAGTPSDPYLAAGFDRKLLRLSHDSTETVNFRVEADISGTGLWIPYKSLAVPANQTVDYEFPAAFGAYWLRLVSDTKCRATGQFLYE